MNAETRRKKIMEQLSASHKPVSATALAGMFSVSRQVIVGDIALLRASGADITATPRGYVLTKESVGLLYTVAVQHSPVQTEQELCIFVDNGCIVEDVIVEHPIYGQIIGQLHLCSRYDVGQFMSRLDNGDTSVLSPTLKEKIAYAESLNPGSDTTINIALNYGGRAELTYAFSQLAAEGKTEITEEDVSRALYTHESGDPDMIVRTGGDLRISNFLLWQAAYAELYFTEKLWPDLTPADVDDMIRDFYSRKRRYGGL